MAQATKAKFPEAGPFHQALKTQVEQYFKVSGRPARDLPGMYAKTVALLGWFAASYAFLVFVADGVGSALLGCVSLGLAMAGIGFSVQHDANHGGYSERRSINRLLALTLDVLGASSYVWSWKHNIFHHSYPNVAGLDADINMHYPALSRIIEKTCLEHGVRYRSQDDVRAALGSHVRWLKRMGQPLAAEAM